MNFNLDFDSVIKKYDRETALNTVQSFISLTNQAANIAGFFDATPELKTAKLAISGIASLFTVRSTINSIEKTYKNLQKRAIKGTERLINALETAVSTIGISSGIIGITRSLHTFKLIDLERFSSALGNIPVAQTLGYATSVISIATSLINISIDSIRMYDRSEKIDRVKEKILKWSTPLTPETVKEKIITHEKKHDDLTKKINTLFQESDDNQAEIENALYAHLKQKANHLGKTGFEKIQSWFEIRAKGEILNKLDLKRISIEKDIAQSLKADTKSLSELTAWNKINEKWNNLTDKDNQAIAKLQDDKTDKWNGKLKSLNIEQIKAGVGIGLKVVGLILGIVSLILTCTGVGAIPALATMAALGLTLGLVNLGFALFKRHTSPIEMESVQAPMLT